MQIGAKIFGRNYNLRSFFFAMKRQIIAINADAVRNDTSKTNEKICLFKSSSMSVV